MSDNKMSLEELVDLVAEEDREFAKARDASRRFKDMAKAVRRDLVALRKRLGLKQSDLVNTLKMTQSAISRIENGDGDIGFITLARYADALGLQPAITFVPTTESLHQTESIDTMIDALRRLERPRSEQIYPRNDLAILAQNYVADAAELVRRHEDRAEMSG